MRPVQFGYAGKWTPQYTAAQQAAYLVKTEPAPVGVEGFNYPGMQPLYRVVTHNDYNSAALRNTLAWTAWA